MNFKRISVFILTVVITLGAIIWSSPSLVREVRLGLDLKGGFEILYVAEPLEAGGEVTQSALKETANNIAKRVDAQGISEPEIRPEGTDRIRARLAGVSDEAAVREMIKKPQELSFRGSDGNKELIGTDFVPGGAKVGYDGRTNQPLVEIKMKDQKKFRDITAKIAAMPDGKNTLGIYLDEEMLSNPYVSQTLDTDVATISGSFTYEEAKKLADTINMGALPLKLTEKYVQSVGATLGLASLEQTAKAGIIGSIIILLFMVLYYRIPGLVAAFTLITYTWLLLLVFDLMHATLTLPGIAALVLGIGMAVDANIITYERIREEIRTGKSLASSVKAGSKHSFRTIMDANVTNIISGVVLYFIGNGAIRGFAVVTMLSIVISIITNVFLSRFLMHLLVRGNVLKKPSMFGVKEADIREL
ncbi:protein translocase subunit SecD [Paenibacillus sp. N1-5-1-14]|uniref:protein translocase subunit SecD n=1 Tax=Paenibacillus radicibacter TaxID=2972488 RepID=UPI0021594811|nr:protein translocase subunit SecD [Paenibacillus radicibacter]MCR8644106.1 protein translocase subunit SecD [Paenibacillus radicibacter]